MLKIRRNVVGNLVFIPNLTFTTVLVDSELKVTIEDWIFALLAIRYYTGLAIEELESEMRR